MTDRRDMLKLAGAGLLGTGFSGFGAPAALARAPAAPARSGPAPAGAKGFDGQRKADLGDGRFLNPIMAGDHPDPSILKDGADYYMTFSTFDSYPGLVIWHSRDLVNWRPIGPALRKNIGSVWAPELCKHGGRFYLYIPTKGPNTSWVIWADRIEGPWSEPIDLKLPDHIDPGHAVGANPLVRTRSAVEKWWSRGHATLVEGPAGDWWSVYHGYENGYWTLGRQALLDPVEWTDDGWLRMKGGDLSRPIAKPKGGTVAGPHGMALSDDFAGLALGAKWNFFKPAPDEAGRAHVEDGALILKARGTAPVDSSPLLLIAGDQAYRFECDIEIAPGGTAGLILFYDEKLYCGLGFDGARFVTHQYGIERARPANPHGTRMRMRVTNDRHIVTYDTSGDGGKTWVRFDRGMEVSGYHHNVRGGFLMLRPGLYSAGQGEARFRNFTFRALD